MHTIFFFFKWTIGTPGKMRGQHYHRSYRSSVWGSATDHTR